MRIARWLSIVLGLGVCNHSEAGLKELCYRGLAALTGTSRFLKPVSDDFYRRHSHDSTHSLHGRIPNPAVIKNMYTPWILVAQDPKIDPVLVRWLERVKNKYASLDDPIERATKIVGEVRKTFGFDEFNPRRPFLSATLATANENHIVKLGDSIRAGAGVCRHHAVLLQLALQDAGIASEIVYGKVKLIGVSDGKVLRDDYHAWVQVESAGKTLAFDSSLRAQGVEVTDSKPFAQDDRELVEGAVQANYLPQKPGSSGPRAIDEAGYEELREHFPGLGG